LIVATYPWLAALPEQVERALVRIVEEPIGRASVGKLADYACMSEVHLRRCGAKSGLGQPRGWLDAIRAIHLWAYAREPRFTWADIAVKIGRSSASASQLAGAFFDTSRRDIIGALDEDAVIHKAIARLPIPPEQKRDTYVRFLPLEGSNSTLLPAR
jgi:AraC-like DNA-binding protein